MFGFGKKSSEENKAQPQETSQKSSQAKTLINKIYENKYHYYCIKKCFKSYVTDFDEEEKTCLAKCSDNTHTLLVDNANYIIKAKSFV